MAKSVMLTTGVSPAHSTGSTIGSVTSVLPYFTRASKRQLLPSSLVTRDIS